MSLNPLSGFFKRFQHLTIPDEMVRKVTSALIQEHISVAIPIERIRVRNNCIYIEVSPGLKSTIFLRKQELLLKIKEQTGKVLSDIR